MPLNKLFFLLKRFQFASTIKKSLPVLVKAAQGFRQIVAIVKQQKARRIFLSQKTSMQILTVVVNRRRLRASFKNWLSQIWDIIKAQRKKKGIKCIENCLRLAVIKKAFFEYSEIVKEIKKKEELSRPKNIPTTSNAIQEQSQEVKEKPEILYNSDGADDREKRRSQLFSNNQNQDSTQSANQSKNNFLESSSLELQQQKEVDLSNYTTYKELISNTNTKSRSSSIADLKVQVQTISLLEDYLSSTSKNGKIDEELAYLNFDNIPYSPDCTLSFSKLDTDLVKRVLQNSYQEFCTHYVKRRTSWGKPIPLDQTISYQQGKLEQSLTSLPAEMEEKAKNAFELILKYGQDLKSSSESSSLAVRLIKIAFQASTELRDEVFLQLTKQLTNNPSEASRQLYLKLICVFVSFIPTSGRTLFPILNFFYSRSAEESGIENLNRSPSKYIFMRICKGFNEPRTIIPNQSEIQLIEHMQQIMLPVYIHGDRFVNIAIESYTTAQQVLNKILQKFDITNHHDKYCLSEVIRNNSNYEENIISEYERILDVSTSWELVQKNILSNEPYARLNFQIKLKIKHFFVFSPNDLDSIFAYFIHFSDLYIQSQLPILQQSEIVTLSTYLIISDLGEGYHDKLSNQPINLQKYLPIKLLDSRPSQYWNELLGQSILHIHHMNQRTARSEFMSYFMNHDLFQTWQFQSEKVEKTKTNSIQSRQYCRLGIKPFQILVLDAISLTIKLSLDFHKIERYGVSLNELQIYDNDDNSYYFLIKDGEIILSMIKYYFSVLANTIK